MTKAKKTLSVLLAVLMVLSTSLFSAFAVAPSPNESQHKADFFVETDKNVYAAGETATVTVKVTTTYAAATTSAVLLYDTNVFENSVLEMNKAFFGAGLDKTEAKPYKAEAGKVGGFIVAKENAVYENKTGAVVFTVQLTVKQGVTVTSADLSIENKPKELGKKGSLFCGRYDGKNVVTYGQTITAGSKNIEIQGGAAAPATLTTKLTGVIDEASIPGTALLYGMPIGANPVDYFGLSDGSTVTFEANAVGATNGTGATVTVGEKVYTLITFGDLDGNGEVDLVDFSRVNTCLAAGNASSLNAVQIFAGDCDGSGEIDLTDFSKINTCLAAGNASSMPANPYAAQ